MIKTTLFRLLTIITAVVLLASTTAFSVFADGEEVETIYDEIPIELSEPKDTVTQGADAIVHHDEDKAVHHDEDTTDYDDELSDYDIIPDYGDDFPYYEEDGEGFGGLDIFGDLFSDLFSSDFFSDFSLSDFSFSDYPDDGEPFEEESNAYTRDLLYDKSTHKQFITVQTRGGNTFYIIIDYDKPLEGGDEQYATYFLNLVDERDLFDLLGDEEIPAATCKCVDKCEIGAINTSCEVCKYDYEKCEGTVSEPIVPAEQGTDQTEDEVVTDDEPKEKSGNIMMIVLIVAAVAVAGGAYYYIKFVKGKRSKDDDMEFFDDDGYEDEPYVNEDDESITNDDNEDDE